MSWYTRNRKTQPICDMCNHYGVENPQLAIIDSIVRGSTTWANFCPKHVTMSICQLGVGLGQVSLTVGFLYGSLAISQWELVSFDNELIFKQVGKPNTKRVFTLPQFKSRIDSYLLAMSFTAPYNVAWSQVFRTIPKR